MNYGKIGNKMKMIEELSPGDSFEYREKIFVLTCDFKNNGDKLVYSLEDGKPLWINSSQIVDHVPIYKLDADNNVISIKNTTDQNKNIH